MTRARILADYVSSGDELALKAPLISPALVTPNLGTPSAGTMTNVTGMPLAGLSATGTASATTYLRGDNAWATVASATMQHNVLSATTATSYTYGGGAQPVFLTMIMKQASIINQSSLGKLRCFYQFYIQFSQQFVLFYLLYLVELSLLLILDG